MTQEVMMLAEEEEKDPSPGRLDSLLSASVDFPSRTIYLYGDIDEATAYRVLCALHILDDSEGEIILKLSTGGGGVVDGLAIFDAIRMCRNDVSVIGTGAIMSMGSIILQAGDCRIMTENARLMIHDGHAELGGDPRTVSSLGADLQFLHNLTVGILSARAHLTKQQVEEASAKTSFFSPKEALKAGLIDVIMTPAGLTVGVQRGKKMGEKFVRKPVNKARLKRWKKR